MKNSAPFHIHSISEFHRLRKFPLPMHPCISVLQLNGVNDEFLEISRSMVFDFYCIALKRNLNLNLKYGQQRYDFDGGVLYGMAPGQVFGIEQSEAALFNEVNGWMLLVHPDLLWHTPLAKSIKNYGFFEYSVNEALFLSDKEESIMIGVLENIRQEYEANLDKFSQPIIINHLEALLNYTDRFYQRQFLTRNIANSKILDRLDTLLSEAFSDINLINNGIPTVQQVAEKLHLSRNYLSSLLTITTGKNTQQHIQDKLIEKARERISTTSLTISEIAYKLGFDHPQSFSRMFKSKTGLSPLAFRKSF
ncbi:helix-turn-helix transcriptional regulator [Mucilaginibacter sp. SMC90]|uniref:helix-turn-helix domain-containing protein n=1 Tax=Mucilaginibacter sp. SMC90 TaxID=2929803 RepID=UPI001FB22B3B|nr:response regulator transcription factor [Mucilaginibacter sp. SMC90]UOE51377.1 helix-turn-helix transcriptional regulator [Mucilaginibacter sp. SMC90]